VTGLDVDALLDVLADRLAERLAATAVPAEPEPWRLLTVREAAARLGRSERWVRERVKAGDLATVRLDGGALGDRPDEGPSVAGSDDTPRETGAK
jgi:hypothetical protein